MTDEEKGNRIRLAAALLRLRPWDDDPAADDMLRLASCRILDDTDRIESLAAENDRLRQALKPFAAFARWIDGGEYMGSDDSEPVNDFLGFDHMPTLGHCRAAAKALGEGEQ